MQINYNSNPECRCAIAADGTHPVYVHNSRDRLHSRTQRSPLRANYYSATSVSRIGLHYAHGHLESSVPLDTCTRSQNDLLRGSTLSYVRRGCIRFGGADAGAEASVVDFHTGLLRYDCEGFYKFVEMNFRYWGIDGRLNAQINNSRLIT